MMSEEKKRQLPSIEVIALPPLKMTLVYAKEERMNKAILTSTKQEVMKSATQHENVESQDLMKIIEHLEKKP